MDIRTLHYFLTIAQEQNITRAAEVLHMAQPPLSRQLQALEEELGVQLFSRSRRGMELTDEGKLLQERAGQIIELVEKTKLEIADAASGVSGTVYIGATETIAATSIPTIISGFKALYPDVSYNVWGGNSDEVIARLEQGLVDFAIVREPYNQEELNGIRLWEESWCALLPADSPGLRPDAPDITIEELSHFELIVPSIPLRKKEIASWFEAEGLKANIICEFAPLVSAVHLIRKHIGCAILPAGVANIIGDDPELTLREITNPKVSSYVAILTKKYRSLSKTAETFLDYMEKEYRMEGKHS